MEDIARMADECMRDVDNDEDDSNLEDDEDLLVCVNSFDCSGLRCGGGRLSKYQVEKQVVVKMKLNDSRAISDVM